MSAAVGDPVRPAVMSALNAVVGVNARSTFRIRPAAWMHAQPGGAGGTIWVVGELDFRTRREPAWARGAQAEVMLLAANGQQLGSTELDVPAGQGGFLVRVPTSGPLAPGDYAVRIRLRAVSRDAEASDTARVTIPERASPVGEAVLWRRGPATGPQYARTSDPRFQRSDRLRLELASDGTGATARLLDRAGKPLRCPCSSVNASRRPTERGGLSRTLRWRPSRQATTSSKSALETPVR